MTSLQQRRIPRVKGRWNDVPSVRNKGRNLFRSSVSSDGSTATSMTPEPVRLDELLAMHPKLQPTSTQSESTGPIDIDSALEYKPSPSDITRENQDFVTRRRRLREAGGPVDVDSCEYVKLDFRILEEEEDDEVSRGLVGYVEGFEPPCDDVSVDFDDVHSRAPSQLYEVTEDGTFEI